MKMKVFKKFVAGSSIVLASVLITNMIAVSSLQAEAAPTLEGINTLKNNVYKEYSDNSSNKYRILEIVPSKVDAEIGYLFGQMEPVLSKYVPATGEWIGWKERLLKCADNTARTNLIGSDASGLIQDLKNKNIPADILEIATGGYSEESAPQEGFEPLGSEQKYGYFQSAEVADGQFQPIFVLTPYKEGTAEEPSKLYYEFNEAKEISADGKIDGETNSIDGNTAVYTQNADGKYVYAGLWKDLNKITTFAAPFRSSKPSNKNLGNGIDEGTGTEGDGQKPGSGTDEGTGTEGDGQKPGSGTDEGTGTEGDGQKPGSGTDEGTGTEGDGQKPGSGTDEGTGTEGDGQKSGNGTDEGTGTEGDGQKSGNESENGVDKTASLEYSNNSAQWLSQINDDLNPEDEQDDNTTVVTTAATAPKYYVVSFKKVDNADAKGKDGFLYTVDETLPLTPCSYGRYTFRIIPENPDGLIGGQFYNLSKGDIYFKNVFINHEVFKRDVLNMEPSEYDNFPVEVITLTYNDLKTKSVPDFDFIYFNGYDADADLTESNLSIIFTNIFNGTLPCVMDGSILLKKDNKDQFVINDVNKTKVPNLFKLAAMLAQSSISYEDTSKTVDTLLTTLDSGYTNGTFSTEQIYFTKLGESLLNDFSKTDASYKTLFKNVYNTIVAENIVKKSNGETELPTDISKAVIIRDIMNFKNKRELGVKKVLSVLEIQPAYTDSKLTLQDVKRWIPGVEDLDTDVMTTAEFIGKLDSINDKYDLIYIGASTDYMNTKDNETIYNTEEKTEDGKNVLNGLIYHKAGDVRQTENYNGNDITVAKRQELLDFLNAGYPIIVDDALLDDTTTTTALVLDTTKVDTSSEMYKFLNDVKEKENVFAKGKLDETYDSLMFFLMKPRVKFEFVQYVKELQGDTKIYEDVSKIDLQKLIRDAQGHYVLEYKFKIDEEGSVEAGTNYNCELYYDLNGDGDFSDKKDIFELNGKPTEVNDKHELVSGTEYVLERVLPDSYKGAIATKIVIRSNKNPQVFATSINHVELKSAEPEKVKVLQVGNDQNGKKLSLVTKASNDKEQDLLNPFYTCNEAIKDQYEFDFTYCTLTELDNIIKGNPADTIPPDPDYLDEFDMVVLGFYDEYELNLKEDTKNTDNNKLLDAIRKYINEGKSILFTANTSEFKDEAMPDSKGSGKTYAYLNENFTGKYYNINDQNDGKIMGASSRSCDSPLIPMVNEGTICNYPFAVGTNFLVGANQSQHIRLNPDATNISVWYCLGAKSIGEDNEPSMYSLSPNDCANNYYLYSQDNVFYSAFTGNDGGTKKEVELFFNTLIACFNAGIKDPDIKILEQGTADSAEMKSINRLFDGELAKVVQNSSTTSERIYFTVSDSNFTATDLILSSKFYYQKGDTAGNVTIKYNGADVSVKELSQYDEGTNTGEYMNVGEVDGGILSKIDGAYQLTDGKIYYIDVKDNFLADCEKGLSLYFEAQSSYKVGDENHTSNKVYSKLDVIKVYLFELR